MTDRHDKTESPTPAGNPSIALIGNPNTGKTTLFNRLTGGKAQVGNYPGVTVERISGPFHLPSGKHADVLDIPGTYSLVSNSREEQIAVHALLGLYDGNADPNSANATPQMALVCVAAAQWQRGLYIALQVKELGIPMVIALTMTDELAKVPDAKRLTEALGCEVVAVSARKGTGIPELSRAVEACLAARPLASTLTFIPSPDLQTELTRVKESFPSDWPKSDALATWALMSVSDNDELDSIPQPVRAAVLETKMDGSAIDDEVVSARFKFLDDAAVELRSTKMKSDFSEHVDKFLLHRVFGFATFLLVMFLLFQSLFAWSDPAITLIETLFASLADSVRGILPDGLFASFIVDGIIAGVGSVIVFLPQILLLFFFLGLLEDSGYMARVAYLMDRIMRTMNLHGRAFVPMLSGFACAVPAILATRTLERRRDRLLTMMVVPLMTCSARLPIYTLVIAALFPAAKVFGFFPIQGLLMVGMYLFSVVVALVAAWVMSKTMKPLRARRLPFVIELPPYRLPRLRDVTSMMWRRTRFFLTEAGTVILVCTVILWALLTFPTTLDNPTQDYAALLADADTQTEIATLNNERDGELLRNSYGGRLGHAIEPLIAPLGFDWKIGVGIIGAFAAREVFISTMGVVYSSGADVDENTPTLRQTMRNEVRKDGSPVYTPLVGLCLMIFFALACQCMSTLAVVRRETGGYKWPAFLFLYMTSLAWVVTFLVYQGGRLLGFS